MSDVTDEPPSPGASAAPGPLAGVRVLELGGEQADYAGPAVRRAGRVGRQGGAAGRQPGPAARAVLRRRRRPGTVAVLLGVQPRQAVGGARPGFRRRPVPARRPAGRRGRADRRDPGRLGGRRPRPVPGARARAAHAVRRGRPLGGVRDLGPGLARARRGGDELRLRPGPGRALRPAADRAAGLALVPHRGRAACHRDRQRAALPAAQRPRPEGIGARSTKPSPRTPRST